MLIRYGYELTFSCPQPTLIVCLLDAHRDRSQELRYEIPTTVSSQIVPMRRGHRVWKTHPVGGSAALGMSPSSLIRSRSLAVDRRHGREQRLGVRMMRACEDGLRQADLHEPSEI